MIRQLIRIRLQQSLNLFRLNHANRLAQIALILLKLASVIAIPFVIAWVWGAYSIPEAIRQADAKIVIVGVLASFAYFLFSLFRIKDPLDPRAFIPMRMNPGKLEQGLPVATMFGLQFFLYAILTVGIIAQQPTGPLSTLFSILAILIIFAQTALHIRIGSALSGLLLGKFRIRGILIFGVVIYAIVQGVVLLAWATSTNELVVWASLSGLVDNIAYLPFVGPWLMTGLAGNGGWELAWVLAGIALFYLAVLWAIWRWLFYLIRNSSFQQQKSAHAQQLGWFGVLPATKAGVIGARGLVYWFNDPRYWIPALAIPVLPIFIIMVLWLVGLNSHYLYLVPIPLMSLLVGWSLHNDTSNDGLAFWTHLSSSRYEKSDRRGRMLPLIIGWLPILLGGSAISAWLARDWWLFPVILGVAFAAFGSALGVSSITSVRHAYPAPKPHDSPFRQPMSAGSSSAIAQGLVLLLGFLGAMIPTGLFFWGLYAEQHSLYIWALVVGVALGMFMMWFGQQIGARSLRKRGPEVLSRIALT